MTLDLSHWYFAYGSNLDPARLARRVGSLGEARRARLDDHRLAFHKRGTDGTGKADVVPSPGDVVWGAVYALDAGALTRLDGCEGVDGGHYARAHVRVVDDDGRVLDAVAYRAQPAFVTPGLRPSADYLGHIVEGAEHHGLPADYRAALERAAGDAA